MVYIQEKKNSILEPFSIIVLNTKTLLMAMEICLFLNEFF